MTLRKNLVIAAVVVALGVGIGGGLMAVLFSDPDTIARGGPQAIGQSRDASPRPASEAPAEDDEYQRVFTQAASDAFRRASAQQGEVFDGVVNGIPVQPHSKGRCSDFRMMSDAELRMLQMPPPAQVPPGAVQTREAGWMCGARPFAVDRVYQMGRYPVFLTVGRHFGRGDLVAAAGERRVRPGTVQGRPAVFIRPVTDAGRGGSFIAFKDGRDLIVIEGVDLRFARLRAAAESLRL